MSDENPSTLDSIDNQVQDYLDRDIAGAEKALELAESRLHMAQEHYDRCKRNLDEFRHHKAFMSGLFAYARNTLVEDDLEEESENH